MKRFISILSILSLVFTVMAVPVFADEWDDDFDGIVLPVLPFDPTEPTVPHIPSAPADSVPGADGGSLISDVVSIFGGVGSWIAGELGTASSLFWNGHSLTFIGVLSVAGLALAVVLLLVFVIVRFLWFRG